MQKLDYTSIGMRIRKARKAKGMSQGILAKECGICLSFMGHIERGTRCMSLETFANICKTLDADAGGILFGEEYAPASVLDMWKLSDKSQKRQSAKKAAREGAQTADSYAMYVRIMKSVAEIMNEN